MRGNTPFLFHPAAAHTHSISILLNFFQNSYLRHKASFKKYKKIKITHCTLSNHNGIKLEINRKETRKISQHMETEQHTIE
jgi:hypothetical protein